VRKPVSGPETDTAFNRRHILDRDYDKALEFAQRTVKEMPSWLASWNALAIAAAHLGREQEVRRARDGIFRIGRSIPLQFVERSRLVAAPNSTKLANAVCVSRAYQRNSARDEAIE